MSDSLRPNIDAALDRFTRECRDQGTPVTHQRLEIYRVLLASEAHPDADSVFRQLKPQFPALSQATVYKTIELLEGLGLVRKVPAPGPTRRFDANRHPHHHLWCVRCHGLTDIESDELAGLELPEGLDFQVMDYTIQFSGVCASCRDAAGTTTFTTTTTTNPGAAR